MITDYEKGQIDLINHIKKELIKITDSKSKDYDLLFDVLSLLKNLKPKKDE